MGLVRGWCQVFGVLRLRILCFCVGGSDGLGRRSEDGGRFWWFDQELAKLAL